MYVALIVGAWPQVPDSYYESSLQVIWKAHRSTESNNKVKKNFFVWNKNLIFFLIIFYIFNDNDISPDDLCQFETIFFNIWNLVEMPQSNLVCIYGIIKGAKYTN